MASRIYDIELECGCLLSADGGGGLIPCAAGYLGYDLDVPLTSEDLELQRKCSEAWQKFKDSGQMAEYYRECERRN